MAIIARPPYEVGEIGKIWPEDPQAEWAHFTAPDGQEFQVRRIGLAPAKVWLLQEGDWHYEWDNGESGTLTAVVPEDNLEDEGSPSSAPSTSTEAPPAPQMGTRWIPGG